MVQGREPALRLLTWVDRPEIYRPLTMLSFAANARVGASATGYHVVNVLLHAGVTLATFALARVVLRSALGAAVAAALFAVHPVHTEAVTNVFGRSELLAALFVLICLLALARAAVDETPAPARWRWLALSLAAFAAGLLSKESAIVALALCVVLHLWVSPRAGLARALWTLLPYAVVAVAYLAWRRFLVGAVGMPVPPAFIDNPLAHVGAGPRVATALVILVDYLRLLTVPWTLSSDYSFNQVPVVASAWDPRLLAAVAILGLLIAALIVGLRRAPVTVVAAAFAVVPLAATANLLVVIGTIKAERLLYLPSVGWCLAAGWLVAVVARRRLAVGLAAAALVVCLFAGRTWARNEDWRDDATAHVAAVRTAPDSAKTHYNRARDLIAQRRLDDAIRHLERSVVIYPDWAASQANLGGVLGMAGRLDEAATHLAIAARLDPASPIVRINLAQVLLRQGRVDDAVAQLETARRHDPRSAAVARVLGALYLQHGRYGDAVEPLGVVAAAEPGNADAQNALGTALLRAGRVDESVARFEAALRLRPQHPQARQNLETARARQASPTTRDKMPGR